MGVGGASTHLQATIKAGAFAALLGRRPHGRCPDTASTGLWAATPGLACFCRRSPTVQAICPGAASGGRGSPCPAAAAGHACSVPEGSQAVQVVLYVHCSGCLLKAEVDRGPGLMSRWSSVRGCSRSASVGGQPCLQVHLQPKDGHASVQQSSCAKPRSRHNGSDVPGQRSTFPPAAACASGAAGAYCAAQQQAVLVPREAGAPGGAAGLLGFGAVRGQLQLPLEAGGEGKLGMLQQLGQQAAAPSVLHATARHCPPRFGASILRPDSRLPCKGGGRSVPQPQQQQHRRSPEL